MSDGRFVGMGLIVVAAIHLVPAILTGTIPSNWPVRPLSRTEKPRQYLITFAVFSLAGFVGVALLIRSCIVDGL